MIAWITTTSGFAISVRGGLVVYSDAVARTHNILAHELPCRFAFVDEVVALLCILPLLCNLFNS